METKKISFGFMKTKKQEKPEVTEKREYIDCVEEKSIKVIGGEEIKEDVPLVIPMKPNTLITSERLKEIAEKVESALIEPGPVKSEKVSDEVPPENETLEQMAARELLQEAKQQKVVEQPTLMVPLPAKPVMEGEKESSLDDYESVPIQEFGLAMLRGMGWTPGQEQSKYKQPQLRPKGLGLGADKVVTENQNKKTSKEKDEELAIVKGSYVKVTAGKFNNCYGKVVSLDEDNGRVVVDIGTKKETVSLSEFMMQAVTKSEFDKESKVINTESYTQYKRNEKESNKSAKEQSISNRESTSSHKTNEDNTREREGRKVERYKEPRDNDKYSNGKNKEKEERIASHRSRNNSSSDEEVSHRSRRTDKKRYSSNDSLSSDSNRKDRKKKKRHNSNSSGDSSEENYRRKHKSKSSKSSKEKRDIDKKRKGKKKKRDRDRSPNYHRKHKK